jgi:hypothetical protein
MTKKLRTVALAGVGERILRGETGNTNLRGKPSVPIRPHEASVGVKEEVWHGQTSSV